MAKLTFILQDGQEVEVLLREDITIGRSEDNEVVVDAPMISARHARVRKSGRDAFEVFDLQSEGGTFVNDERVNQQQLSHGDRLKFGHLHAVFAHEAEDSQRQRSQQIVEDDRFDWLGGDRDLPKHETAPIAISHQPQISEPSVQRAAESASITPSVNLREEEEKNSALQKISEALEKKIQAQKDEIADLELRFEETKTSSESIVDEVQMLEARRDTLLSDLRDAHSRTENLQSAATRAEESRQRDEERLATLLAEITLAETGKADALQQQAEAQSALSEEQQRLQGIQSETQSASDKLGELKSEIKLRQQDSDGLATRIDTLSAEERRLQEVVAQTIDIEQRHADCTAKLQQIEEECLTKEAQRLALIDATQKTLEDSQAKQAQHDDIYSQLQQVVKEYNQASENLHKTRNDLADKSLKLQQTDACLDDRIQRVTALQGMLGHLQTSRDQLNRKVDHMAGTHERLQEALKDLHATQQTKAALEADISALTNRRLTDEKAEAELKQLIEKQQADFRNNEAILKSLKESNATQTKVLSQTNLTLATERADLAKLREEAQAAQKQAEDEITKAKAELAEVRAQLESTQQALKETEAKRAEIAQQCVDLADVEGKLGDARTMQDELSKSAADLRQNIEALTIERLSLEGNVKDLTGEKESLTTSVHELEGQQTDLNKALEGLIEQERVDRERFKEIQRLVSDAEHERTMQIGHLDRQILLKQRELHEVEERLEALRQWKEEMERRYEDMESLDENTEEARARWRSINAEKGHLGQFIAESENSRATAYSNGPVLRGHARQLEAKIRRDEDRYATIRRKVENLIVEEMDRSERVASLERRLAQLRVDVSRAEREHMELGLQPGESAVVAEAEKVAPQKSILSSIIDGARSRLKPMVQQRED